MEKQDVTVVGLQCPYCGEEIEIDVEVGEMPLELTESCSVCCNPILLIVRTDEAGNVSVTARRENE